MLLLRCCGDDVVMLLRCCGDVVVAVVVVVVGGEFRMREDNE